VLGGFTSRVTSGLIAAHLNWQMSFVTLGILGLLGAAVLARWLPPERRFVRRSRDTSTLSVALDHLRNRKLLATFFAGFCLLFSLLGCFTYITFYLSAPPFHLDSAALGSLFCVYLFGALITPNAGRIIDRYGERFTIAAATASSLVGMLLTLSHSLWIVVAGLALICTGVFVSQSCTNSYIGTAAKHSKALAVGLYVTFYYVGGSVGSSVSGIRVGSRRMARMRSFVRNCPITGRCDHVSLLGETATTPGSSRSSSNARLTTWEPVSKYRSALPHWHPRSRGKPLR
jgi:YNFM family putative membrane transporter